MLLGCLAIATTVAVAGSSTAKNIPAADGYWNQYRGPNGDGTSPARTLPVEFSETKNLRWKTRIHSEGWSSPVVWGNQVWLTTGLADGTELFAVCVDLNSGDIIHDIKVFDVAEPQTEFENLNTHASPTPTIEDGRIYVHFGSYGTACLDAQTGKKLWERRDLNCNHLNRPGSSPIIDDDTIYLHFDGSDAQFEAALDKSNGRTRWLKQRRKAPDMEAEMRVQGYTEEDVEGGNQKAFATPAIIEYQGRRQLISPAAQYAYAYDPATGEELWHIRYPNVVWSFNGAYRPVFGNGLVYLLSGGNRHLLAVRPSGSGDVTETHVDWLVKGSTVPSVSSPLIVDDLLFIVSDAGLASCLEAKSGHRLWRKRLRAGGIHWSSPLYANGRIYFCGRKGVVSVVAAERKFRLLAENKLDDGFHASPAVADDALLLRSFTHLYCFAEP